MEIALGIVGWILAGFVVAYLFGSAARVGRGELR